MQFYQEITLAEQIDVDLNYIISMTLQALHGAIAIAKGDSEEGGIAIAFPEYKYNPKKKGFLGKRIRCFAASEAELASIDLKAVLRHLSDYAKVAEIKAVGDKATHYEIYTKYRHKNSVKKAQNLYDHLLKKFGQEKFDREVGSFEVLLEQCEARNEQLPYPYANLVSKGTGEPYPLRIKREIVTSETKTSAFSGYGLSDQSKLSTVPAW